MADDLKELTSPSVDFLILADRAEVVNGKLYLMGGAWEHIMIQDLQQPALISLAIGVLVPWTATNQQHRLRVTIEDPDAREIDWSAEAGFAVGRPAWADINADQRVVIAVPTAPIIFPNYGSYLLQSYINHERARNVRFRTINPAATGPQGPARPTPA